MTCPMLKFAANVSTMFSEFPIYDRFMEARHLGFSAFEAQNLYNIDIETLKAKKELSGLEMILINSPPEVESSGSHNVKVFGYACDPGKKTEFFKSVQMAVEFAGILNCKKIHILAGLNTEMDTNLSKNTYIENLSQVAVMLQKESLLGVIEPICPKVKPSYFLNNFDFAVECIKLIGNDHLKLLLDIYHLEMLHGNALSLIDQYYPYTGHIQVSQAPNREEPSSKGLIDYKRVFQILESKRYSDYIGLEYTPARTTAESLQFLKPTGTGYFHVAL